MNKKIILLFVGLIFFLFGHVVYADIWPQLHYNSYRTGATTENVDVSFFTKKWTRLTGEVINSSPVVANVKFIVDGKEVIKRVVYVTSEDKYIYALDADTREEIWKEPFYVGESPTTPAVLDNIVYVCAKSVPGFPGGVIYALDAATGSRIWSKDTGVLKIESSPAVIKIGEQKRVYFCAWWRTYIYGLLYLYGYVYCLDGDSGSLIWCRHSGWGDLRYWGAFRVSPAVNDDYLYMGSQTMDPEDGKLYGKAFALDRVYGFLVWIHYDEDRVLHWVTASPAVSARYISFGDRRGYMHFIYRDTTGKAHWRYPISSTILFSIPAVVHLLKT